MIPLLVNHDPKLPIGWIDGDGWIKVNPDASVTRDELFAMTPGGRVIEFEDDKVLRAQIFEWSIVR